MITAGWRHCPRCAANLERGAVAGEGEIPRLHCPACGLVLYENPAPTASAIVVDPTGRIMLTRREREPFAGAWDVPGGFMEAGETPEGAMRRELLEETGLEVEPVRLLTIVPDVYGCGEGGHTLNIFYVARVVGGVAEPRDDVSEIGWFALGDVPPLAFRNGDAALAAYRASRSATACGREAAS